MKHKFLCRVIKCNTNCYLSIYIQIYNKYNNSIANKNNISKINNKIHRVMMRLWFLTITIQRNLRNAIMTLCATCCLLQHPESWQLHCLGEFFM